MTHLRQQMIDAMHQRGFSDRTHQSYLASVRDLARHFHKPPDQIAQPQIQQYFNYLVIFNRHPYIFHYTSYLIDTHRYSTIQPSKYHQYNDQSYEFGRFRPDMHSVI